MTAARTSGQPVPAGPRPVRAPRGTELSCRDWPQEAAMRMLMNNLDPEVAEHPDQLIVYGGSGRAARSWDAFDAIVGSLRDLRGDETLLVQSGKPVGVFRTHEWAPRVLIANSNLVPQWATWDEFRRLESLGLTMFGQMTAGSWIYIGTQGILQGTYETFAAVANKRFGGSLAGTITLTAGLGGMGGAQPLAVTMNGGVAICIDCDPASIGRRIAHGYLDTEADDIDDAIRLAVAAAQAGQPLSIGLLGNAADRASRWPRTSRRWSGSWTPGPRCSTTATRSAARPSWPGTSGRSPSPVSSPPTSGRCSARAGDRSGGRRCPATRPTSRPRTGRYSTCSPTTSRWPGGSRWPRRRSSSRACRPGSAGSATASGTRQGCASTTSSRAARSARRSCSAGITWTAARSPRRTGRPRGWPTAPTRSPTGRCSTRCSTPRRARPGSRYTTAAESASAARSTRARSAWPTARRWQRAHSSAC